MCWAASIQDRRRRRRAFRRLPCPRPPRPAPVPVTPKRKPTQVSSDYTAPNAPRIHIVEDKTPTLNDSADRPTDTTDIPTPDVEASQQGDNASSTATSPDRANTVSPGPDTPPTSATPSDPEASQTGTTGGDTEVNQTGTANPDGSPQPDTRASYRIQAGTFADAANARDLVNSLHDKGMDANIRTERQGDKTVYKVQVGAYHSRAAADDAATDFRSKGVPVTVSPVNP